MVLEELLKRREYIGKLIEKDEGSNIVIAGRIENIRDLGKKLKFITLSDNSGEIQLTYKGGICVYKKDIETISPHTHLLVEGDYIEGLSNKGHEVLIKNFYVLGDIARPIPIDSENPETSLDKRLDYRWIDLRRKKSLLPITLFSELLKYSRQFFYQEGFKEIISPKIIGAPSESGSEVFEIDYFGRKAYLAQSPQFYKQMAIASGFEKVFEIGPVFRANPSDTSRHDSEFTSIDTEIAYIPSHEYLMDFEEKMLVDVLKGMDNDWGIKIKKEFNEEIQVPTRIPRIKMKEAYEIVGQDNINSQGDLIPLGERELFKYVKDTYDNEFVFVTDYPYSCRPFYHMKGEEKIGDNETTKSYDLLFRGLEVTTGAQREHRYNRLIEQIKEKQINPIQLSRYPEFFEYGCPPHGGFGFGPTRFLTSLLNVGNVREVTFLPRDKSRISP